MARSPRSHYRVVSVTPDFGGDGESTPVKTANVTVTGDRTSVSIFPIKRTSTLGISLLAVALIAFVPLIVYVASHIPNENKNLSIVLGLDIGVLATLFPIMVYLIMQAGNKITVDTGNQYLTYKNALGSSVKFRYRNTPETEFHMVYFSNTTAQSIFNRKGWAVFYRNKDILFRMNMERWDVADLRWMAENLRSRIVVVDERTGFKYVEKLFPGYFPMFASKPVLSGILIILAVSLGLILEFALWALALHIFPA